MSVRTDVINLRVNVNGNTAQNNLNELRKAAKDIAFEMGGLKKGTQEYVEKSKQLKQVTTEMDALKKSIGITALSQKELRSELSKLNALKGSVVPFSKEFNELQKQIKGVEQRLYDVKNGVQGFGSTFSKITDSVKQFTVLGAAALGFNFLKSQFDNIVKGSARLSDQLADLQRVSGLTATEASNLNDQLSQLDTRTSTEGLRNIAIVAGKLGVAKNELLSFTAAVDKLVVALGDELGDADAITSTLGKILNVFDGQVTGDNISRLGNAFVELANAGVASGGFIAEFAQRLSGVAKDAGIGLGAITGLGAGLEEMGARVESSSTAIQGLLVRIGQDLPAAAKIAGISEQEFRKLYGSDATEALLRYSEGLVKNKSSFAEFTEGLKDAGEEGARTIETISKLGNGSTMLREKIKLGTDAFKETTAITNAFQLKNQTLGAEIDKLGKKFTALTANNFMSQFLANIVGGFNKFLNAISNTNTALDDFRKQQKVVQDLAKDIAPLVERVDELQKKSKLSKDEQNELAAAIKNIAGTIPSAITEFDKYGRAIGISTTKAREFINLQTAILREKNREAIKESEGVLKGLNDKAKLYQNQLASRDAAGNLARTKLVQGEVVLEKLTNEEIAKRQVMLGDIQNRIAGVTGILAELKGDKLAADVNAALATAVTPAATTTTTATASASGKKDKKDGKDKIDQLRKDAEAFAQELKRLRRDAENNTLTDAEREKQIITDKYNDLVERTKKYWAENTNIGKQKLSEIAAIRDLQLGELVKKQFEQGQEKEYAQRLESLDNYFDEERNRTGRAYAAGKQSKKEYEETLSDIERLEMTSRVQVATDYAGTVKKAAEDVTTFSKQQQQQQTADVIAGAEARKQATVDDMLAAAKLKVLVARPDSQARLDAQKELLTLEYELTVKNAEDSNEVRLLKEEEFQQQMAELEREFQAQRFDRIMEYVNFFATALDSLNTIIANRENRAFQKEKQQNDKRKLAFKKQLDDKLISQGQYDKKVSVLQEQQDAREREIKRRQAKREKVLSIFSIVANTAAAIMQTYKQFGFPVGLPFAIAQGAIGLLQLGAVASAPLPELGRGGFLSQGPSHSDGDKGLHVVNPRTGRTEMLVERDEAVLNKRAMRSNRTTTLTGTPRQIASALNSSYGGVSFAGGARWMHEPAPRIRPGMARVMAGGGIFGETAADDQVTSDTSELRGLREDFAVFNNNISNWQTTLKANVVLRDIQATNDLYQAARRASSISG